LHPNDFFESLPHSSRHPHVPLLLITSILITSSIITSSIIITMKPDQPNQLAGAIHAGLFIASFAFAASAQALSAQTVLVEDTFSNASGSSATQFDWYSHNGSADGTVWDISGDALRAPGYNGVWTSALKSFSSVTLDVGDSLSLSLDIRQTTTAAGTLNIGLANLASPMSGNILGSALDPGNYLSFRQDFAVNSKATLHKGGSTLLATSDSASTNITTDYQTVTFTLTRLANGLEMKASIGSTLVVSHLDTAATEFTFNTIRLATPGNSNGGVYFDNITLTRTTATAIPEPATTAALVAGACALAGIAGARLRLRR
jgi:hypothetical protein